MRLRRYLMVAVIAGVAVLALQPGPRGARAATPTLDHVFVIVMENKAYGEIVGSSAAPYFNDIRNNAARCQNHVVPFTKLPTDLASASMTPNYAFITPDMCSDTHDCAVATGDAWLQSNVPSILNSAAFTSQRSLLAITWDET